MSWLSRTASWKSRLVKQSRKMGVEAQLQQHKLAVGKIKALFSGADSEQCQTPTPILSGPYIRWCGPPENVATSSGETKKVAKRRISQIGFPLGRTWLFSSLSLSRE